MRREVAFSDLVPLWRTIREDGVTALITPALDYVGGLELGTLDVRYAGDDQIASIGEALRSFVSSLDDETTLHFLQRVDERVEEDIDDYEARTAGAEGEALATYVAARGEWLGGERLLRTRVFLFFSGAGGLKMGLGRGLLGGRLLFGDDKELTQAHHHRQLGKLARLRDRLTSRLAACGVPSRELLPEEVRSLHYELLNPGRARRRLSPPDVEVRETLWAEKTLDRKSVV
jgi:hypothetical protein